MAPAAPRRQPLVDVLLCLYCFVSSSELATRVHGQTDALGFISIDCGIAANASYSDESTWGLRYVSDAGFVDAGAGANADIGPPYNDRDLAQRYLNVRYFPAAAARSCYTLRGLSPRAKYLVRCTFYYGNYDGLSKLPSFELHLGVNRWATVNITAAGAVNIFEAVTMSPADFLQVCLVNTGSGTPFISGIDLRPLKATMYPEATVNQSLLLLNLRRPAAPFAINRYQFWRPAGDHKVFRYPFDPHDRIWQSYGDIATWTNVSTADMVSVSGNDSSSSFDEPSMILQRAAAPANNGTRLDISWSPDTSASDAAAYLLLLYFAEVQKLPGDALRRRFDILVDGASWNGSQGYSPGYLAAETVRRVVAAAAAQQGSGSGQHTFSLVATPDATLPPILNAFEVYSIWQMPEVGTNDGDAKAMMTIRSTYVLMKNWMGDPCAPKAFAWDGLNCSYSSSGPASITALNLSSSGLTGAVDPSIGDLKSLLHLDMSKNSLTGPIPDFLAQMPSLIFIDLSSNNLGGPIPAALLEKRQQGSLVLRTDNNPNLCGDGESTTCSASNNKERNRTLIIAMAVPIAMAILLFVVAILVLRWRRNKQDAWMANNTRLKSPREEGSNLLENRRFTYKELKLITANFRQEIGKGGFGDVFLGYLENQSPVAVKIRSKSSCQGDKEFLAEARHLSRVHHRNLVSLIGYCKDKKHLALVYEYMDGGDLQECLRGEPSIASPLGWHRRLKIALDAAHGLEYLHKSCQPPLIHRDVKSKNILLSADLKAKLSDFGLTKVFAVADELVTHVTTQPAGTLGYLDPEYYHTSRLSEKSDVYSFGVVLLELITGQPPAVPVSDDDEDCIHVAQWVRRQLSEGSIESIADAKMATEYDVNSVWKAAELALRCQEQPSRERPAMADVVGELTECLALEASRGMGADDASETSAGLHSDDAHAAGDPSLLELGEDGDVSATSVGPAPR